MFTLQFQEVWERTLSPNQKEQLHTFFKTLSPDENELTVTPFLIKYKKNGGINATVFIHNGFNKPIQLNNLTIQIINDNGELIANHRFHPDLFVQAKKTMPWSFVFPKHTVIKVDDVNEDWTISIES